LERPRIILLVGLPGSGKSSWAAHHGIPVLSSDQIRQLVLDDVTDQRFNRRIFQVLRYLLKQRLEAGRPVTCVDATHLTRSERRPYLAIAEIYGGYVDAIFFDMPLNLCKTRNQNRARVVPEDVMDRMAARMTPPDPQEGFRRVLVVTESTFFKRP
jgi:predicted kinase